MERVLQHLRRGLADPHPLLRVILLQHSVQWASEGAAALQQLGRVSRWVEPSTGRGLGWQGGASGLGNSPMASHLSPQCTGPGMSGHRGASAPVPVAVASVTAHAPAGPRSLEATPVRVPRSKRNSAILPCALVGERECVAGGWGWAQQALAHPGTQLDPFQVHLRVLRG